MMFLLSKLLLMLIALQHAALLFLLGRRRAQVGGKLEAAGVAIILFNIFTICFAILDRTDETLATLRIGIIFLMAWFIMVFRKLWGNDG